MKHCLNGFYFQSFVESSATRNKRKSCLRLIPNKVTKFFERLTMCIIYMCNGIGKTDFKINKEKNLRKQVSYNLHFLMHTFLYYK